MGNRLKIKLTSRQHLVAMGCVLLLAPLVLFIYDQRRVKVERERLDKLLREEQKRIDFLIREINAFKQPDLATARTAVLDAQGRLRGLQIEGNAAEGRYISNRPAAEVNDFLSGLSLMATRLGLQIVSHRGMKAANPRLEELIIREMKFTGSFRGVAQFVSELGKQPYRVLILQSQFHQPDEGPLQATLVISL